MIDRGAIYGALFALLQTTPGFLNVSERLKYPDASVEQPALFLRRFDDDYLPRDGVWGPTKVFLTAEVIVYYYTSDPNEAPGVMLDVLIGNVDSVLAPAAFEQVQTLGGLVKGVWIEGKIQKDDGALTGQAGAIIPLKILVTS